MDCARVVFSGHAIARMFERGIERDEVLAVVATGETIADYPEDRPYASELLRVRAGTASARSRGI
jgi:hypothetical protein